MPHIQYLLRSMCVPLWRILAGTRLGNARRNSLTHQMCRMISVLALISFLGRENSLTGYGFGVSVAHADSIVDSDPALAEVEFGNEIRFLVRARSVRTDDPLTSVLLLYRVDDSAVQNTGVPSFQPGAVVSAVYRWRVSGVLLPGAEVRYQFQIETRSGVKFTTPEQSVTYNDTRFDWREVKSGKVTAHWHSTDANTGQAVLDEATRTLGRLEQEFGLVPDRPISLYAYVRAPDYASAVATSGRSLEYAVGAGMARVYVLYSDPNTTEALMALRREIARTVFDQKTTNPFSPPPRWLSVGFSRYVAGEDVPAENQKVLTDFAQNNKLLALKTLAGNLPTTDRERALALEESLSAVKYLAGAYPPEKIRAMFEAFKEGNTVDDALKKGLGNTLDQFETKWKNSLRLGLPQKPNTVNPTPRAGGAPPSGNVAPRAGSASGSVASSSAGPEALAFVDQVFGQSVDFWQTLFGEQTRYVLLGALIFIVAAVGAVVIGSVAGAIRRARDEG